MIYNKKVLFRNSQFLMALQFCSNTLLRTSSVQLLPLQKKRKEEGKEHLTEREQKGHWELYKVHTELEFLTNCLLG